jgi:hypothetical protein
MKADFSRIQTSKKQLRGELARLSIPEKLRLLEELQKEALPKHKPAPKAMKAGGERNANLSRPV